MKYAGAHVGQLPKLSVCNGLNGFRIVHNSGIRYQETGHVGPVLVQVCVNGSGYQRAGDIGTASGEGFHGAVRHGAVEAGDNGL